jgi:hypothetical protein
MPQSPISPSLAAQARIGADGMNFSVGDMTRGCVEQPLYGLPGRRDLLKAYAD